MKRMLVADHMVGGERQHDRVDIAPSGMCGSRCDGSISVWEVLVLLRKQRLRAAGSAQQSVADALARAPLREAPITHAVARESERFSLIHWDPADRFIAATAELLDATLVTADARLIAAPLLKVLPNP